MRASEARRGDEARRAAAAAVRADGRDEGLTTTTRLAEQEEMRLRSGHVVGVSGAANRAPRTAAEARAMLMGARGSAARMGEEHRPTFDRGVKAVFERWTAMQLAVVNAWGGIESERKAVEAEEEISEWFASKKHKDALELEDMLIEILADDFNVTCEDGSPREVANALCAMYEQCADGNYEMVARIEATPLPREALERSKQIEEDRRWTMNGGEDMDQGDSSSDGEGDDEMEEVDADDLADQLQGAFNVHQNEDDGFETSARNRGKSQPDDDGWCTIPTRRR